jgi:hypothetical protein
VKLANRQKATPVRHTQIDSDRCGKEHKRDLAINGNCVFSGAGRFFMVYKKR